MPWLCCGRGVDGGWEVRAVLAEPAALAASEDTTLLCLSAPKLFTQCFQGKPEPSLDMEWGILTKLRFTVVRGSMSLSQVPFERAVPARTRLACLQLGGSGCRWKG